MNQPVFKKWLPEEEDKLLDEVKNGLSIFEIARMHDRSKRAIDLRLLDIGIRMINKNIPMEIITKTVGKPREEITHRIAEIANEKKQPQQQFGVFDQFKKYEVIIDDIINIIKDIRNKQDLILSKLG